MMVVLLCFSLGGSGRVQCLLLHVLPAGQASQEGGNEVFVDAPYSPGPQTAERHVGCPAWSWNSIPDLHATQKVEFGAPLVELAVPAGHGAHASLLLTPVALDQRPSTQSLH